MTATNAPGRHSPIAAPPHAPPLAGRLPDGHTRLPQAAGLKRPELLRRLDLVASQGHLGLVVAPAGSGKTTLMAQWAARSQLPTAWCRLDSTAAAADLVSWLWQAFEAHVPGQEQPPQSIDALISVLGAHRDPLLLVIDDLHAIRGSQPAQDLERFVLAAPPTLRMLLGARAMPRVNLARSELPPLVVITGDDLRFRTWEVEKLFHRVHRSPLPPHDVAALTRYTQGWAAALQLFHLATVGKPAAERRQAVVALADHARYAHHYLSAQVLATLPAAVQQFLVRTCVFDVITASRCDALLGTGGAAEILRDLVDRQALTTSHDGGHTFTYHDVLRRHLEATLREELGAAGTRQWYRRTAEVLEGDGAVVEALRARARAEDWSGVRALLAASGPRVFDATADNHDYPAIQEWTTLIPRWLTESDPWCALAEARRLFNDGQLTPAAEAARRAREQFTDSTSRRLCDEVIAAVAAWRDPAPVPRPTWRHLLRNAVRRQPLATVSSAAQLSGAGARLVTAVGQLLGGQWQLATSQLRRLAGGAVRGNSPALCAQLILAAVAELRGVDPDRSADDEHPAFDDIAQLATASGFTWLARLATGLSLALRRNRARHDLAEIVDPFEARGDMWAAALITLLATLVDVRSGKAEPADLSALALRFRDLDGGTLAVWCDAVASLLAAALQLPDADHVAEAAEAQARGVGVPGATALVYAAHALVDVERREQFVALAQAAAEQLGLGDNPWDWLPSSPSWSVSGAPEAHADPPPDVEPTRPANVAAPPTALDLRCFGGFALDINGAPADLSRLRPRARLLLKFLAAHAGRRLHRDVITAALWADLDHEAAVRNFQVNLSGLRSALEPGVPGRLSQVIRRDGETYELHLGTGSRSDVLRFEAAVSQAQQAHRAGDDATARSCYREAVELYGGELIPEAGSAEWVLPLRATFASRAAETAAALAELELAAGHAEAAADAAQRSIDIDHYRDDAWRCLVRALRLAGEPAAAHRAIQGYRAMLVELGVADDVTDL